MLIVRRNNVVGLTLMLLGLYVLVAISGQAERLPVKTYTTADGLAQNAVNLIVRDSRGFLWFCTDEGLSRFDGYTFTNYTTADGLPHPIVRSLLETRGGAYWVGTYSGVCRFNPKGRPPSGADPDNQRMTDESMFVLYSQADNVNALLEDRAGVVWAGGGRGLYRLEQMNGELSFRAVEIGLPQEVDNDTRVRALIEDNYGALWIGAGSGLYRRWPDGRTERYTTEHGLPANDVLTLLMDTDGQLWVGTRKGLSQIALEPGTHQPRIIRVYTEKNELPNPNTRSLFQSSTGQLWVGLITSLVKFVPQAGPRGSRFRHYVSEPVLGKLFVQTLAEDRDGNLWIGTDNGALKLARNGFTTYTEADGLGESRVSSIFESRAGELGVMTIFSSGTPISWFEGRRFRAIRPQLPRRLSYFGFGWHQLTLQDRAGEWWLPTGQGLVRYPKTGHDGLASTPPKAVYTTRDGLVSNDVFRLYEDSRSDIWIATFSEAGSGLTRWERGTETFHHYREDDGLPLRTSTPLAFTEDRAGNLWIGFDTDALARFRDGRFTVFTSRQFLPSGMIFDLYLDDAGRLWIASTGGLVRLDDPSAEQPRFITYTTAQGLSSNNINCITEDRYGRIYVGTGRGVDRLDTETGRVKVFTAADGLISGEVLVSFRDRKGDLWFGGKGGLSRLIPQPDPPQSPPPILITGLRIGGETHRTSALGETEIAPVELGPDKNQIQIDFVALGFSPGEGLRYQYKLEGSSEDWSQLADQRTVNFARLAPGNYRFLVQAVNSDGVMSERAANFAFTILPPLWQRWWFIAIIVALGGLIAYVFYRYRVARLVELERVRTRIASDLHDDIGSNLTKIGILSEVVRQQGKGLDGRLVEPLSSIARISRESVASMSDIVWAINPKRDTLRDLTRRMREFAGEIFANRNVEFELRGPSSETYLKLGADVRRTVFLIFKEAVNNIVRHSGCDRADIALRVEGSQLVLSVGDDGKGFDASRQPAGNGLASMRSRATLMGGEVEIASREPSGTVVTLRLPIKQGRLSPNKSSNRRTPRTSTPT
jgi:ligand-binding sensor domain-containing protein/two-component sensor histidine kinase